MQLYEEILLSLLRSSDSDFFGKTVKEIVELECYKALKEIKEVIEDNSLNDEECFMKIEEIVCIFELIGSNGGTRHDFG